MTTGFPYTLPFIFDDWLNPTWGVYGIDIAWFVDPPNPADGDFVEETGRCKHISFSRGRDTQLDQINPLTGSLTMHNDDGRYSPDKAGPLHGYLLPMRVGRIRCTYRGVRYELARFLVDEITPRPHPDQQECIIRLTDAQSWLEMVQKTKTYTNVTSGTLIGQALTEAGWPAALRSLDVGQLSGITTTYTDKPIWSGHILECLLSERGIAYIGRDGKVVYEDRAHRNTVPHLVPQSTIVGTMQDFQPTLPAREIANDVVVTYLGGTVQRTDASSQAAYGPRRLDITATLLGLGDATSLADWLLSWRKDPHSIPLRLMLLNSSEANYTAMLSREISDCIAVTETKTGVSAGFYIERIEHEIDREMLHQTTWTLTLVDVHKYWLLGVAGYSGLGVTTRLGY